MASFSFHHDQENALPVRTKPVRMGVRTSARLQERASRTVLGEIKNVVTRLGTKRPADQDIHSTTSCDETIRVNKQLRRSKASNDLPGLTDITDHECRGKTQKNVVATISAEADVDQYLRDLPTRKSPDLKLKKDEDCASLSTLRQDWRVFCISDKGDIVSILSKTNYNQDVYNYLRSCEENYLAKHNYLSKQPEVTPKMRCILIDWLVEVSEAYKLHTETLYLAVSYIDRFLSSMSVQRGKLQLVGTAAMFIASKYEEIHPPDSSEFAHITDNTYTKCQVLRMERLVLKVLDFKISGPSSHLFVSKFSEMAECEERVTYLGMYLNELSLMSVDFLSFSPSLVAAASVALARRTVGQTAWPESVAKMSGYQESDFEACLVAVNQSHMEAENCPHQAIRTKYSSSQYHAVSEISPIILSRSI